MPPLDFANGLPDIPDEDYTTWRNDQWRQGAQEQLDAPLQDMPAPPPAQPQQQADDGFLAQAQQQLDQGVQSVASAAGSPQPDPQDNFLQDAQKQLADTTAKVAPQVPTALPSTGAGGGGDSPLSGDPLPGTPGTLPAPSGLVWNGTYWQDPNFSTNIQRYGTEIAKQLGPSIGNFAMAQARLETGSGSSLSTPYNYGNVGNTDSNPRGGGQYGSPEEAAQAWVRFITNNGNNASAQQNRYFDFLNAGQNGADVGSLATIIKKAGYATDPDYASKLAAIAGQPLPADTPYTGMTPAATASPTNPAPSGNNQSGNGLLGALDGVKDWLGGVKDQLGAGLHDFLAPAANPNSDAAQELQTMQQTNQQAQRYKDSTSWAQQGLDASALDSQATNELANGITQAAVGQNYDDTAVGQSIVGPVLKAALDPTQWLMFAGGTGTGELAASAIGGGSKLLPAVGRSLANGFLSAEQTAQQTNDPGEILKGFATGVGASGLMEGGTAAAGKVLGTIFSRLRGHLGSDSMPAAPAELEQQPAGRQPLPDAQAAAADYNRQAGLPEPQQLPYVPNDVPTQQRIAQAYDQAPHAPDDPAVKASYQALGNEVEQQYKYLTEKGVKFEPFTGADPYFTADPANPSKAMQADVRDNNHLWVYAGDNTPGALTPEQNWQFRAVHDYFGHAADGNSFGPRGEENAWLAHRQMFSDEAIPALTTETRGQNSWVNFGPHSDMPRSERPFSEQKATLLPEEFHSRPELDRTMGGGSVDMLKPGEGMGIQKPEDLPNYGYLSSKDAQAQGVHLVTGDDGIGFDFPGARKGIRPFIRKLRPNMRLPYSEMSDPDMERFLDKAAEGRQNIQNGTLRGEGALVGHFATLASEGRGSTSYARVMNAMGDEAALRLQPDLQLNGTPARKQALGAVVRPEVTAANITGDTTDAKMMAMHYAILHPDSYGGGAGRDAVIKAGTDDLYSKLLVAGHGAKNDREMIQGLPKNMGNRGYLGGGTGWKEVMPKLWQKTQDWAASTRPQQDAIELYRHEGLPGEAMAKGPFVASMSGVSPEGATLDRRMLRDVFGLNPGSIKHLSRDEYNYLVQQLGKVGQGNSKYAYGHQWLPWQYLGGEKVTYDSVMNRVYGVSDFFNRAEQLAKDTGRRVEDVIPDLAGQEAKTNVQLGDPNYVTSQIGLASNRLQHLPAGAPWSVIKQAVPQIDSLARQAGVDILGGVKTGLGFWREGEKADFEKNFNLVVHGPKAAVEWFAATMAKMEPSAYGDSQGAVLVTHYGQGGTTPAIKLLTKGLSPEAAEAMANKLIDHVNGFDMGWENVRAGQGHIHMVGLDEGGNPMDPADFQARVNKVDQALRESGIATTGSTEVQLADARVIHSNEYDGIIRGGPRGAYSPEDYRPLEPATDAGGAGDRSPPGGARPTESIPGSTSVGDNNRGPLVPAQEGDGLTYLQSGLKIPGRSIAGGALGAAAGNISTPADATDEERHQRIAAGAAAGVLGGYFGPAARDMLRPALDKAALTGLGREVVARAGDVGYRWNRALAPLRNVPDDVRGAFVEFGNRRLQNQQIAKTLELEGEARFGRTGSATNGLDQAMEFEETSGLRGATPEQEQYLDQMRRFGRASNSVGRGKGFIFGDVTEPSPVKSAVKRGQLGETQDRGRVTPDGKPMPAQQNAGPEELRPTTYFPHLYEKEQAAAARTARRLGLSPQNFYSFERGAPTLREAATLESEPGKAPMKPVNSFTGVWSQYANNFLDSEAKADLRDQLLASGAVSKIGKDGMPQGMVPLGEIDPIFRGNGRNIPGYAGTPAVADALKALTQASWFRSDAPGAPLIAGLMNIGGEAKKQLLTLSGFHAKNLLQNVYRGVPVKEMPRIIGQSLYHAVSPKAFNVYRLAKADAFEDAAGHGMTIPAGSGPDVGSAVAGELKRRAVGAGMGATFGYGKAKAQGDDDFESLKQGLAYGAAGGLLSGKLTDEYAKALWTRLVPTLKVESYQALSAKAGEASKDAAAEFANNSFGGQNLAKVGRSQTVQDMLRLSFLASDWWEGWGRMIGSSIPDTALGGMSKSFWLKTAAIDGAFTLEGLNYAFNGHLTNQNEDGRQFELETTGLLDKLGIQHQGRQYLDILGPIQAILKLATTGNIGRFYESRTSIPGSAALQLHEDKDYSTGQPIIEPGTTGLQAAPQIVGSVVSRVAPVGLQQAQSAQTSGRAIPGEAASMITGMRQYSGPDKGAQIDQRDTQVAAALSKVMSDLQDSQQFKDATPEERIAMQTTARTQLQQQIGDQIGIAPSKAIQGRERKYNGVSDPAEEKHIDLAIQKVQNWTRDPQHYPRPSTDDIMLESRYKGNLTPAYQRQQKQTKINSGDIASLIDKYAPAYSGR